MTGKAYQPPYAKLNRQQWLTLIDYFDGDGSNCDDALDVLNLVAPAAWREELDSDTGWIS